MSAHTENTESESRSQRQSQSGSQLEDNYLMREEKLLEEQVEHLQQLARFQEQRDQLTAECARLLEERDQLCSERMSVHTESAESESWSKLNSQLKSLCPPVVDDADDVDEVEQCSTTCSTNLEPCMSCD